MLEKKNKHRYVSYGEAALLAGTFQYFNCCTHYYIITDTHLRKGTKKFNYNGFILTGTEKTLSAPTKRAAARYLGNVIQTLIQENMLACIIGCTEDVILINDSDFAVENYKKWCVLLTPSGKRSSVIISNRTGPILEGYSGNTIEPSVGSIVLTNKYFEATYMIWELYVRGYLNRSIHKVMKECRITDYNVPTEDPLFDCPELLYRDDWFSYNRLI